VVNQNKPWKKIEKYFDIYWQLSQRGQDGLVFGGEQAKRLDPATAGLLSKGDSHEQVRFALREG
jgi:hypothetical protein